MKATKAGTGEYFGILRAAWASGIALSDQEMASAVDEQWPFLIFSVILAQSCLCVRSLTTLEAKRKQQWASSSTWSGVTLPAGASSICMPM